MNDSLGRKKKHLYKSDEIAVRDRLLTPAAFANMRDGLFSSPASLYHLTFFLLFV